MKLAVLSDTHNLLRPNRLDVYDLVIYGHSHKQDCREMEANRKTER